MELQGQAAIVTGGASGLGAATARALAAKGARVAVFDTDEEGGGALARSLDGLFCNVNVTQEREVRQAFARARERHGQECVLVNCAGISRLAPTVRCDRSTGAVEEFPLELFELVIQVNLIGTFRCIAQSAVGMLSLEPAAGGERGVIINTASISAEDGGIGQVAYSASKAGVGGMTLPMARDLARFSIRVNSILPGPFETPMLINTPSSRGPVTDALLDDIPFPRRLGQPEEFAGLALEMIRNGFFNGANVRLDGATRLGFSHPSRKQGGEHRGK